MCTPVCSLVGEVPCTVPGISDVPPLPTGSVSPAEAGSACWGAAPAAGPWPGCACLTAAAWRKIHPRIRDGFWGLGDKNFHLLPVFPCSGCGRDAPDSKQAGGQMHLDALLQGNGIVSNVKGNYQSFGELLFREHTDKTEEKLKT